MNGVMGYLITAVVSTFGGGSLIFWLVTRWLDRRLGRMEAEKDAEAEAQREEYVVRDEYEQLLGRLTHWLVTYIVLDLDQCNKEQYKEEVIRLWYMVDDQLRKMRRLRSEAVARKRK